MKGEFEKLINEWKKWGIVSSTDEKQFFKELEQKFNEARKEFPLNFKERERRTSGGYIPKTSNPLQNTLEDLAKIIEWFNKYFSDKNER